MRTRVEAIAGRLLDTTLAAAVLVIGLPLLVVIGILVRLTMGSPILFRQPRAGRDGRTFTLVKFRTMRHPRPDEEGPGSDGARLTRLGRLLRATSLDELPTMANVVGGRMRLVGPRPLPVRYLERYSAHHARRHEVPPGITGHAQINGRNALSWDEQLDLDVWYVDNRSLGLDLAILVRTATAVLRRDGISSDGHATRPEFPGSGIDTGPSPGEPSGTGAAPTGQELTPAVSGGAE